MRPLALLSATLTAETASTLAQARAAIEICRDGSHREREIRTSTELLGGAEMMGANGLAARFYRCRASGVPGDHRSAFADCPEAARLSTDEPTIQNGLSAVDADLGDACSTLTYAERVVTRRPGQGNSCNTRSSAHDKFGNIDPSVGDRLGALESGSHGHKGLRLTLKSNGFYNGAIDGDFDTPLARRTVELDQGRLPVRALRPGTM